MELVGAAIMDTKEPVHKSIHMVLEIVVEAQARGISFAVPIQVQKIRVVVFGRLAIASQARVVRLERSGVKVISVAIKLASHVLVETIITSTNVCNENM